MAGGGMTGILVSNLPHMGEEALSDKLEIHFGRRSNGGNGDVVSVHFLDVSGQQTPVSALVTFAEEQTVRSVLGKQHLFLGRTLGVEPFRAMRADASDTTSSSADGSSNAEMEDDDASSNDSFCTASGEDFDDMADCDDPRQMIQLSLDDCPSGDQLIATAADLPASTRLAIDEKSARYTLMGPVDQVMETAAKLCRGRRVVDRDGSDGGSQTVGCPAASSARVGQGGRPSVGERMPPKAERPLLEEASKEKRGLPKQSQRLRAEKDGEVRPRHTIRFDPKLLSYMNTNIVCHEVVNSIRGEFRVTFETRPGGTVVVNGSQPGVDQQSIASATAALEELIQETKESGLETQRVDLRLLSGAPQHVRDAAVKRAIQSTLVLVTKKGQDILEFFGTELCIRKEIEELKIFLQGGQSPDELGKDGDVEEGTIATSHSNLNGLVVAAQEDKCAPSNLEETASSAGRLECLGKDQFGPLSKCAGLKASSVASNAVAGSKPWLPLLNEMGRGNSVHTAQHPSVQGETLSNSWGKRRGTQALCSRYDSPSAVGKGEDEDYGEEYWDEEDGEEEDRDEEEEEDGKEEDGKEEDGKEEDGKEEDGKEEDGKEEDWDEEDWDEEDGEEEDGTKEDGEEDEHVSTSGHAVKDSSTSISPKAMDAAISCNEMDVKPPKVVANYMCMPRQMNQPSGLWDDYRSRGFGFGAAGLAQGQPDSPQRRLRPSKDLAPPRPQGSDRGDFSITMRSGMTVTIRHGDLTDEFADIIVSAADSMLCLPLGVGRAVRKAAGPELVAACRRWVHKRGPVEPGQSVWTVGGNLKCSHVLHVVPLDVDNVESTPERLKEMLVDILKTCTFKLLASVVAMPAVGLTQTSAPRKFCPKAFLDAVLEINKLCLQGFIGLDRLTLVDRDLATVWACQEAFSEAILDGRLLDQCLLEGTSGVPQTASRCSVDVGREKWAGTSGGPARHGSGMRDMGAKGAERVRRSPSPDNMCSICLCQISNEKQLRCGHRFCRTCLTRALRENSRCPYCRRPV